MVGEEDVRVWYEDVVDLDGVCCGVDLSEGDVFVAEEGGEAGSLGHVEEVVEGEGGGGGGGVVEEEGFEEPERVWGVSDGGVSDGEDGWVLGRFEEGRGVVEKVCHEKEACSSESVGSIAREFMEVWVCLLGLSSWNQRNELQRIWRWFQDLLRLQRTVGTNTNENKPCTPLLSPITKLQL